MKLEDLNEAILEARRFLQIVEYKKKVGGFDPLYPSKETSALRRSSMDLTRSLSKLRNNNS